MLNLKENGNVRGWYSGCALAFQARETSSILVPRSMDYFVVSVILTTHVIGPIVIPWLVKKLS